MQGRMLTSAALLLCALSPLSLRLDMLHRTGPLLSSDCPRAIEHTDAGRMAQQHRGNTVGGTITGHTGAWQIITLRDRRKLCSKVHAEAIYCTARAS